MTRREWLKQHPPPAEAGPKLALLEQAPTPAIKQQLNAEIAKCAKCAQHGGYLHKHKNRMEDLFVCYQGASPHFFIWTKVGAIAALAILDITKPIPDLDAEMEWI